MGKLVEAQRLRINGQRTQQNGAPIDTQAEPRTDRRRAQGRTTQLAILEALQACEAQCALDLAQEGARTQAPGHRMTARTLAAQLRLHPSTVYTHLKQLSAQGIIA